MTTETTNTGWLLVIASAICLLGALVIVWARSEWSEKQARKAEAIIVGPTELTVEYSTLANVVTVKGNEWRPDVDRDMHQAVYLANVLGRLDAQQAAEDHLASVAPVVPLQRRGGAS